MGSNEFTPGGRPTKAAINRAIRSHMDHQATLVGYRQLRALSLSPEAIENRVQSGELFERTKWPDDRSAEQTDPDRRRRRRLGSVFSGSEAPLTLDGLYWRAVLSAPAPAWIDGAPACALLDLERLRGSTIQVVHLGGGWKPPLGVTARRTTVISPRDHTEVRGIPCLAAARAIVSGANDAKVDDDRLDAWLLRAIELRVYDERALRRVIAEREMIRGARRSDAALDRLDDLSTEFRSVFEQKVTRLVQTSSLIEVPVLNALLDGFRPDLGWRLSRAIVECDGRDYHRSMAQIIADEQRETILRARGYVFLRLRWADVQYEPERTLRRIEQFVLANMVPPMPVAA